MRAPMVWRHLGLVAYEPALALQETCWQARTQGGPDTCLALEHPPTITSGRRTRQHDLCASRAELVERGIAYVETERGGALTYHGPGQLVLYPIVGLRARGFGVREFVTALEEIMIEIARAFGIGARRDGRGRGGWTARGKLGAGGIGVGAGVSTHGLALNVAADLEPYRWIVPCGMTDVRMTSLEREGARDVSVAAVLPMAERACARWLRAATLSSDTRQEARL
jgi:lipoate-protein ligase B